MKNSMIVRGLVAIVVSTLFCFTCAAVANAQMVKSRKPGTAVTAPPASVEKKADEPPTEEAPAPARAENAPSATVDVASLATILLTQEVGRDSQGHALTYRRVLAETHQAAMQGAEDAAIARVRAERANQKTNWIYYIGASFLVALMIGAWMMKKRNRRIEHEIYPVVTALLVSGLLLHANVASAQTPAPRATVTPTGAPGANTPASPATPATPAPKASGKIISINPDAAMRGGDPFVLTINTNGVKEAESLEFPAGVTVDEFKVVGQKLTAKLTIDATTDPGPLEFNVVVKNGGKIESTDKVVLVVFTQEAATVVDYLMKKMPNVAALRNEVNGLKSAHATFATKAELDNRAKAIQASLNTYATKKEVSGVVKIASGLNARINALRAELGQTDANQANLYREVGGLSEDLAEVALVEKGLIRKKPQAPEVASSAQSRAERIKAALAEANAMATGDRTPK